MGRAHSKENTFSRATARMGFVPKEDMIEFIKNVRLGTACTVLVSITSGLLSRASLAMAEQKYVPAARVTTGRDEAALQESNKSVREKCMPAPKSPQWALSMMQREILTAVAAAVSDSSTRKQG